MKSLLFFFIFILLSFSFYHIYYTQTITFEEIDFDNAIFFQGYNNTNFNDFFEELHYIKFDSNTHTTFNQFENIRLINDTFYINDVNSKGRVFLYSAAGEFLNVIGLTSTPSSNSFTGSTYFEKCFDSGHLIIGYPNEQKLLKFSNDGDLVSQDSIGFYFGDFVYNSNLKRYLFHTYMPYPGFSDSLNHQVVLTDSNFTILNMLFPNELYDISKEFNIGKAFQRACEDCDYVYYADFFNGKIYELDFIGNERLIYKIEDGIENRQDSLITIDPQFPSYEVIMHNERFYPFTEYFINEDFLVLLNHFDQRVNTQVVFNRETLHGNRFINNIPVNLISDHQFNFHFEAPTNVIGNYFVRFRSPRTWNQIINFLPDSIDISHLPDSMASGPMMKLYKYDKNLIGINNSSDRRVKPQDQILDKKATINYYPNPTSGLLTIETSPSVNPHQLIVKIYSLDGRELKLIKGENAIDFSSIGLKKGTYIIHLEQSDKNGINRLGSELIIFQ